MKAKEAEWNWFSFFILQYLENELLFFSVGFNLFPLWESFQLNKHGYFL